jgi:membrane-associated protein
MPAESATDLLYHHGPMALVLLMALNRFGIVPGGMFILITVGTLARLEVFSVPVALLTAYAGVMLGDTALYGAGRYGLGVLLARRMQGERWARAQRALMRWETPAVFMTRWLLLPLTIAVSLLSGLNALSYRRFLAAGALGNLLFVLIFVGVGYRFTYSWRNMLHWPAELRERFIAGGPLSYGLLALIPLAIMLYRVLRRRSRRAPRPPIEELRAEADPLG